MDTLKHHQLFAKMSKCKFAVEEVEYLAHLISGLGVRADPVKIVAMLDWPIPTFLKSLKCILGLTIYYRKFIKRIWINYSPIDIPFEKKKSFEWSPAAQTALLS